MWQLSSGERSRAGRQCPGQRVSGTNMYTQMAHLATANARRSDGVLGLAADCLVRQMCEDARARHAQRVAKRNRTAAHVEPCAHVSGHREVEYHGKLGGINADFLSDGKALRRKGFVDLNKIDVLHSNT